MKKGFTLMELLLVIALIAFLSVSSIILFGKNNEDMNATDLKNKYKEIQTAAILYVDLNDSWLSSFTEEGEAFVRIGVLQNENYLSSNLKNPVTGEDIPSNALVKIYTVNRELGDPSKVFVNSCIIINETDKTRCIANKDGNPCGCCDYPISSSNPACAN